MLKAFIVLSSDFKNKNQDELMKELQEYMQYNAAAWMCPEKVIKLWHILIPFA